MLITTTRNLLEVIPVGLDFHCHVAFYSYNVSVQSVVNSSPP